MKNRNDEWKMIVFDSWLFNQISRGLVPVYNIRVLQAVDVA